MLILHTCCHRESPRDYYTRQYSITSSALQKFFRATLKNSSWLGELRFYNPYAIDFNSKISKLIDMSNEEYLSRTKNAREYYMTNKRYPHEAISEFIRDFIDSDS